jgi:hypothetical protein
LDPRRTPNTEARGAWHFDPVIREPSDLKKRHYPEIAYDADSTLRELGDIQAIFGDILTVTCQGVSRKLRKKLARHRIYHMAPPGHQRLAQPDPVFSPNSRIRVTHEK